MRNMGKVTTGSDLTLRLNREMLITGRGKRFDETGEFHGTRLAGDRLADGGYEPVPIETVGEGILQVYSRVINLLIRWGHGQLGWHDPETGEHIVRYEDLQARADAAEARIRELEVELERHRQG